jgi:septal ring factor EnvC (AmiA/AmiB activator)
VEELGRRGGLTARRRRGDAHRIVASVLAVLALVGCVVAILLLAIAPTAARLDGDIGSLNARLSSTQSQLAALQTMAARTAAQGSRLTRRVRVLDRRASGLSRTVHGLQAASTLSRNQSDGLRACFSELQRELTGLTLHTRTVRGKMRSVGLSESAGLSPACGGAFGNR